LVVDGGEIDLVRFNNSAVYYKGILFGDFRIAPYDATNKNV
jgi:hypothetical protein